MSPHLIQPLPIVPAPEPKLFRSGICDEAVFGVARLLHSIEQLAEPLFQATMLGPVKHRPRLDAASLPSLLVTEGFINALSLVMSMRTGSITLRALYEGIQNVQRKLDELTAILAEREELSDETLEVLQEARESPEEEYVPLQ